MSTNLFTERTCHFSPCRKYRYSLKIVWDATRKPQMFIGLNPSTADEENDDPTIRRCIDFAQQWGAGGIVMANACAYRTAYPEEMLRYDGNQIGRENTVEYLEQLAAQCQNKPIAAWGKHANKVRQFRHVAACKTLRGDTLKRLMGPLDCLRLNGDGSPAHPLYLKATLKPIPFNYY